MRRSTPCAACILAAVALLLVVLLRIIRGGDAAGVAFDEEKIGSEEMETPKENSQSEPSGAQDALADVEPSLREHLVSLRDAIVDGDSMQSRWTIDATLASMDAENVAAFRHVFRRLPEHGDYRYALERFAAAWASFDGQAAADFVLEQEDALLIESDAAGEAMAIWASYAPEDANAYVLAYPRGGGRLKAFDALAYGMYSNSPSKAEQWAKGQSKQRHRNIASHSLGAFLMSKSPSQATAWIDAMGNQPHAYYAAEGAAYELAKKNPERAMAWAMSQEETFTRKHAAIGALQQWSEQDSAAAAEWLSETDSGLVDDAFLIGFIKGAHKENPEVALSIIDSLEHETHKDALLKLVYDHLLPDPGA